MKKFSEVKKLNGNINNYFLGGNTSCKFFSLFHEAIDLKQANRVFYLKGGPGTGKSTLMKSVGSHFETLGYDIDYFHCSSDCDSLDCILINNLKIALFDGTAPHTMDPKYPGAVDEIVDLSLNWDESKLKSSREKIIKCQENLSVYYDRCFSYLKCCRNLLENNSFTMKKAINHKEYVSLLGELSKEIFSNSVKSMDCATNSRHLFISAFAPQGAVSYVNELIKKSHKTYLLKGYIGRNHMLQDLMKTALNMGLSVDAFHNPLAPEKLEHIYIKELNISIVSDNQYCPIDTPYKIIYLDRFLKSEVVCDFLQDMKENKAYSDEMLSIALNMLKMTKKTHDDLENIYIDSVDFNKINSIKDSIIEKIHSFI